MREQEKLRPPASESVSPSSPRSARSCFTPTTRGPVPIDLLCQEQDRLTTEANQAERHIEVAEASFADIEDTLGKALDLLADCQRAYLAAPGHLRRQWNQALFERLVVYDDKIGEAEIAEPFATLADPELPKSLGGKAVTASAVSSGAGSSEAIPVGLTGRHLNQPVVRKRIEVLHSGASTGRRPAA
jgi:hypothetical protein